MPREFLKKLAKESMKENAGTTMSEKEENKFKIEEIKNKLKGIGTGTAQSKQELENIMQELRSPKDISEVEKRVKNFTSRESARGAVGEAAAGSVLSEIEKNRLKDDIPEYSEGGEIVFGKGKDYIKDLL